MSPATELILKSALSLPEPERLELADRLFDSCEADDDEPPSLSEAWQKEVERRWAEYDAGLAETVSWESVKAKWQARRAGGG